MSPERAALGTALFATALAAAPFPACAVIDRSVEPRDGGGRDVSATEPSRGGSRGTGGRSTSGAGGAATGEDAATDASEDADVASGGVTSAGGRAGTGGDAPVRDAYSGPCPALADQEGVLLCDDFEATELLPVWRHFATPGEDGQTNFAFNVFPHRGERGLISLKHRPGPRDPIYADVLGGRTSGHLYLRVWMYFPSQAGIVDDPNASATIFVLGEREAPYRGCGVALWRGRLTIQCDGEQAGSFAAGPDVLPVDRFLCIRYDFPIGTNVPASEFRIRVGETTLINETTTPTTSALDTGYSRLWLGINHISDFQTATVVLYYDDVVVATDDIACE